MKTFTCAEVTVTYSYLLFILYNVEANFISTNDVFIYKP